MLEYDFMLSKDRSGYPLGKTFLLFKFNTNIEHVIVFSDT